MASYWNSIGTMLEGNRLEVEPRRRSRFEPEQDDPQGFALDVTKDESPDAPVADANTPVNSQSELKPRDKGVAEPRVAAIAAMPVDPEHSQGRRPISAGSDDATKERTQSERLVGESEVAVNASAPRKQLEPNPKPARAEDVHGEVVPAVQTREHADARAPMQQPASVERPRVGSEATEDSPEHLRQPDHDVEAQTSIAEMREEIADIVRAEPLDESIESPPDDMQGDEPSPPRPMIVEIDHISIEIARPSHAVPTDQRTQREPAKPVISLDEFLDRTGGGAA